MFEARSKRTLLAVVGVFLAFGLFIVSRIVCLPTLFAHGLVIPVCPDGALRQTTQLSCGALRRGQSGWVELHTFAHFVAEPRPHDVRQEEVGRLSATLSLVDAKGTVTPLAAIDGWTTSGKGLRASVQLPDVPDGDYRLRAEVEGSIAKETAEAPLALYAPAKVHVLTDRPLYEAGNDVKFRALVVRARDLAPLDGRPGRFVVTSPEGEVLLEERAAAGPWGVVAGSFPLDEGAATGDWRVRWESGDAREEITFRVEPFTLPRFRLEAATARPFYGRGDRPTVTGRVLYASGAPVAGAELTAQWTFSGGWPPPTSWRDEGGLPKQAKTDASGGFELTLPTVPADLQGQARITARLSAVDPAGDRVEGAAVVLLSEDAIAVDAVPELEGGLVEGFNNRLFLRIATADGRTLPLADVTVRRAWDASDKGVVAKADADGVAVVQIDPGPAVNVVVPPPPPRLPPRPKIIQRGETSELFFGDEPSLGDQLALDRQLASLEPCARFAEGADAADVGLRIARDGRVLAVPAADDPLSRCFARTLDGRQLPAGRDRFYRVSLTARSEHLARLASSIEGIPEVDARVQRALTDALLDARPCVPETTEGGSWPELLDVRTEAGRDEIRVAFLPNPDGVPVAEAVKACVRGKLSGLRRPVAGPDEERAPAGRFVGYATISVDPAERLTASRPQATTFLGYELEILAKAQGEALGRTKLRLTPGAIPMIRLRASPVLAKGGETVEIEVLRGPNFNGELPEKLWLRHEKFESIEAKLDREARKVRFPLPAQADGFWTADWNGARAIIWVRPAAELSVELATERPRYAPGETAKLLVRTAAGGQGRKAAVGLFGVDESLGQLAPLPGPGELARLRPKIPLRAPGFPGLDGEALLLGRIRGANAAAATVLRLGALPTPAELDVYVSSTGQTRLDPIEELTDRYWVVLSELHALVRVWEEQAPAGEKMRPAKMAELWRDALAACEARNDRVTDAFGRRLTLSNLPADLLGFVDPRAVVVKGTRLPEDTENWAAWVAKEKP